MDGIAGLLLGYPDATTIATVVNPNTDAYSNHYAFSPRTISRYRNR